MFIVDAHLDLAMNALEWNRDLRMPLAEINAREQKLTDKPDRGHATVSLPELLKGNIGLVVATLIARYVDKDNPLPGWNSPHQAWAQTQGQLAWYQSMVKEGWLTQILNRQDLQAQIDSYLKEGKLEKTAFLLSLEGADSIVNLDYLEIAVQNGLKAIGPAHYGPGRYAFGTDSSAPLSVQGFELLKAMEKHQLILDVTHLCDAAFWDAIHYYNGPVWASHSNCRSLVDHNRQFSDEQLKILVEKGAVIGSAFDAWMIVPNWIRGKSNPQAMGCTVDKIIDHMLHLAHLAGNTRHIGLGTDLDGAFGTEQCPSDITTIKDLQGLPEKLSARGFTDADIHGIMGHNWIDFLMKNLT